MFITLVSFQPLKISLWRWWYNLLARNDETAELLFMNYGYAESQDESFVLQPADAAYRYPIQLYRHVLDGVELDAKDVAEVGSGRGGGASWLARYFNPHHITAIDLSPDAVAFCDVNYKLQHLSFKQGRADALPLPSSSQDVLINIESSHCYPNMTAFVKEVERVLRPGGLFAFCDMRAASEHDKLIKELQSSGLELQASRNISSNVLCALDRMSESRQQVILKRVPIWLRRGFRDFVALKGTTLHEGLRNGDIVYVSCLLRK